MVSCIMLYTIHYILFIYLYKYIEYQLLHPVCSCKLGQSLTKQWFRREGNRLFSFCTISHGKAVLRTVSPAAPAILMASHFISHLC